jgi:hypothetical protein
VPSIPPRHPARLESLVRVAEAEFNLAAHAIDNGKLPKRHHVRALPNRRQQRGNVFRRHRVVIITKRNVCPASRAQQCVPLLAYRSPLVVHKDKVLNWQVANLSRKLRVQRFNLRPA